MNNAITIHAKTIEQAIQKATKSLQVPPEKIGYQVVVPQRRKLFGYGKVTIQAFIQTNANSDELLLATENVSTEIAPRSSIARSGSIWVKDGEVKCQNGIYNYPLLTPCFGLDLFVNGRHVTEKTVVSEEDVIEVYLRSELNESSIHMEISEDKMEAIVEIKPGYTVTKKLRDLPASQEVELEIIESIEYISQLSEDEVILYLLEQGIKVGIDYNAISEACSKKEPQRFRVAEGIKPILAKNGQIDLFFEKKQEEKETLEVRDVVNWKERNSIVSVRSGDVIAIPVAGIDGVPGVNIFGELVPVELPKEIEVVAGEGTAIYGLERRVVATSGGRLNIEEIAPYVYKFQTIPQLIHYGNVNMETGNIRFQGDLFVLGDVEEGMLLEAGGSLHVMGTVTNAEIRAHSNILINGAVIGSTLTCGRMSFLQHEILPNLKLIYSSLEKMVMLIKQLQANHSFSNGDLSVKGLQPLIKLMTEMKFKGLPKQISIVAEKVKRDKELFSDEIHRVLAFLEKTFLQFSPNINQIGQLESVINTMEAIVSNASKESQNKYLLKSQSLTNCKVAANWNVEIEKFIYGSDVNCNGNVSVNGTIRGGSIMAGNTVEAVEIGSNGGSQTRIVVNQGNGSIRSKVVWPDSVLTVATESKKVLQTEMNVCYQISKQ